MFDKVLKVFRKSPEEWMNIKTITELVRKDKDISVYHAVNKMREHQLLEVKVERGKKYFRFRVENYLETKYYE